METLEGEQAVSAHKAALEQERLVEEARSACRPYPEEVAVVRGRILDMAKSLRAYAEVLDQKDAEDNAARLVAMADLFWLRAMSATLREPKDILELLDRVCELIEFDIPGDGGVHHEVAMVKAEHARGALCGLVDNMRSRAPEALR